MALHTLTLGITGVKKRTYKRIRNQLYHLAQCGYVPLANEGLPPLIYIKSFPGVTLKMLPSPIRRIELKINPSRMFGGSYTDLCDLAETALTDLRHSIDAYLDMIQADFSFSDMCLSRIDCTQDIVLPKALETTDLIDAIKRSKLGRGYERTDFSRDYINHLEKNRHSFRASCEDISLTVYDKGFQLAEEGIMPKEEAPVNRLRFEVAFDRSSFRRVMNEHLQATYADLTTGETIMFFSKFSMNLLQKYFCLGLMPGRYLRLDLANAEIDKSDFSPAIKERMKNFIAEVRKNYRYGVDGALCDLSAAKGSYLLKHFQELNLNPATLPMRCKCAQCPSIQELLKGEIPA